MGKEEQLMDWFDGHGGSRMQPPPEQPQKQASKQEENQLTSSVQANIATIHKAFGSSADVVTRQMNVGVPIGLVYIEGLIDQTAISEFIIQSMQIAEKHIKRYGTQEPDKLLHYITTSVIATGEIHNLQTMMDVKMAMLDAHTVLFIEGCEQGLAVPTCGWRDRGVNEPSSETVIRGPREAFSESLRTNTTLVRRKIHDENLYCEQRHIGKVTKTNIAVMYINGIADENIVKELYERLNRIDTDAILESGYIEEYIQDSFLSPFPTVFNTERPDVVAAGLLEGRIAIFVDGTPFVLLVPVLFVQFFQTPEDYYERSLVSSLLRLLRYASFFIALLAPSTYIAITTFHQEMLPTPLLISLAAQREGIPFPAFVEAVIMEITFEVLREAGLRTPRPLGQTISIVGALVIGQSAVEAGFVSAAIVIVVSITAISSFALPAYNVSIAIRILRFLLMMLAASFGLFGITMGLILMVVHLCSLRSFSVPYLAPITPTHNTSPQDTLIRLPHWLLRKRPAEFAKQNNIRNKTPIPRSKKGTT
jgi:spore germination protein KA